MQNKDSILKQKRLAAMMTQQELADEAHIARNTVQTAETGQSRVSFSTVTALATALGCDAKDLAYLAIPTEWAGTVKEAGLV